MTFEEKIKEMLVSNGMYDYMANDVMERIKADEAIKSTEIRWDDDVDGYPPQMLKIVLTSAKVYALEYIDETIPNAWFRPIFAS